MPFNFPRHRNFQTSLLPLHLVSFLSSLRHYEQGTRPLLSRRLQSSQQASVVNFLLLFPATAFLRSHLRHLIRSPCLITHTDPTRYHDPLDDIPSTSRLPCARRHRCAITKTLRSWTLQYFQGLGCYDEPTNPPTSSTLRPPGKISRASPSGGLRWRR